MLFDILIVITILLPFVGAMIGILDGGFGFFMILGAAMGGVAALVPLGIVGLTWTEHANDLALIAEQQRVISVYEQQRNELNARMSAFDYPKGALLNADTPVAAIVAQLGKVEADLAKARVEQAKAYRSIEARKLGIMSSVVDWVGEPR